MIPLEEREEPIITHNEDGTLTRKGAMIEARKLWGDLATITSTDDVPMVWRIGDPHLTIGRGRTWEEALARSARKKAKLDLAAAAVPASPLPVKEEA